MSAVMERKKIKIGPKINELWANKAFPYMGACTFLNIRKQIAEAS